MENIAFDIAIHSKAFNDISLGAIGLYFRLSLQTAHKTGTDLCNGDVKIFGKSPQNCTLSSILSVDKRLIDRYIKELTKAELITLNPLTIVRFPLDNKAYIGRMMSCILAKKEGSTEVGTKLSTEDGTEVSVKQGGVKCSENRIDKTSNIIKEGKFPEEAFNKLYIDNHLSGGMVAKYPTQPVLVKAITILKSKGWDWLKKEMGVVGGKNGAWSWVVKEYENPRNDVTKPKVTKLHCAYCKKDQEVTIYKNQVTRCPECESELS